MEDQKEDLRIEYTIKGKKYFQEELDLEQDKIIAPIVAEWPLEKFKDLSAVSIRDLLTLLEGDTAYKFLQAILIPENETDKVTIDVVKKIKTTKLIGIINDFFTLNPELISWLGSLSAVLAGIQNTALEKTTQEEISTQ